MNIFYLIAFVLVFVQVISMLSLLFWVYRTTRKWGLAFIAAGYLEWPITNKELINKLTRGQTQLLKTTSIMKSSAIALVVTIVIVYAIKNFWNKL